MLLLVLENGEISRLARRPARAKTRVGFILHSPSEPSAPFRILSLFDY